MSVASQCLACCRFLWEVQEPADLTFRTALGVSVKEAISLAQIHKASEQRSCHLALGESCSKVMLCSLCQKVKLLQNEGRPGK